MLVEVCANSLESALNAQKAGADRIELCSELAVGGITPSYGLLKLIREQISIPVHVLIRPRSGDFTYSDLEFEIMMRDISLCVEMGFDGVVSGVLHKDYSLDGKRTEDLVRASANLNFTFHRAFDWVRQPLHTLRSLEDMGVSYVLTSGQKKSALAGIELLQELNGRASNIVVMPGSGINDNNAAVFKEKGFKAVHLSGTKLQQTLLEDPLVSMNSSSFMNDDKIAITSTETIKAVVDKVK
ncbi:copper homeostasis protein CutC [Maribacter sp. MMG018]|uniref:copper homeostasis protein CutC n=1 Tax=Maribacter sp. MMG018 TaxID=2822688 RepID=UPI001B3729A3|nr:copper homeostasis protein CutC [Maribacter sp. MMG018]MBQ4913975.1 copper homeostasis protein CutC [Maribacter sp. MMG018]